MNNNGIKHSAMAKIVSIVIVLLMFSVLIAGMVLQNGIVVTIGVAVLFGGGFLLAVAGVVALFVRAKRYNDSLEDRKQEEQNQKDYINSTNHNANDMAVRQIANWLQAIKVAKKQPGGKGKTILSLVFVITFVGCMVAFVVLSGCGFGLWCILPWGIGVGMIILALIITKIMERMSIKGKRANPSMPAIKATVVGCYVNSEGYTTTGSYRSTQTSRIVNTTYRVLLDVDGKQMSAFSKRYYNEGEEVYVRPITKVIAHIEEE